MLKKIWKNQQAFTLIEMMVVLLIISVLLIITIPNVTKHNSSINSKGCEAYKNMIQGQVEAYQIEHNKIPTIADLKSEGYIKADKEATCPNGKAIVISTDGKVSDGSTETKE